MAFVSEAATGFTPPAVGGISLPASGTWRKNRNITKVWVECYGGGGAGGFTTSNTSGGGGGSGGGYSYGLCDYPAIDMDINYVVGVGKQNTPTAWSATTDGDTYWDYPNGAASPYAQSRVSAQGGNSGSNCTSNGTSGVGGAQRAITGFSGSIVRYAGGAGGNGNSATPSSGGGGSGAGSGSNGNNGSGTTGGGSIGQYNAARGQGANGVTGTNAGVSGVDGQIYGGAGSGGSKNTGTGANTNGGSGGGGIIVLSYYTGTTMFLEFLDGD